MTTARRHDRPRRDRATACAAAVVTCALVVGLSACSAPDGPAPEPVETSAPAPEPTPTPVASPTPAPWTPPAVDPASLPEALSWNLLPDAPPDPDPGTMPGGRLVAPAHPDVAPTLVYDAPRGVPLATLPAVQYRGDARYPVIADDGDWYQILLPVRRGLPSVVGTAGVNDATGWVHADDVAVSSTDYRIVVSLSAGTVTLTKAGAVVVSTEAGTGKPASPTPVTRTFIMSIDTDPTVSYTPAFLDLGAHSPTLDTFHGGAPTIAIHAYPTHRGAISNGCLRVPAANLDALLEAPIGTPVLIEG